MKDSGIHFFMIISLVTLVGCAALHEPTSEQIELANYGRYPDNYKEIVTNFMSDLLFDPYSAVYSGWCGPKKGWVGGGLLGYKFGYGACVKINAKNRMGGYVGEKLYYFVINNGQIVHHDGGYRNGSYGEQKIINSSFAPLDTGLRHIITSFTSTL